MQIVHQQFERTVRLLSDENTRLTAMVTGAEGQAGAASSNVAQNRVVRFIDMQEYATSAPL
jgi:hypothetical protein